MTSPAYDSDRYVEAQAAAIEARKADFGTDEPDPIDPTGGKYVGGACVGCQTGTPAAGWLLGLLGIVGLRRRR